MKKTNKENELLFATARQRFIELGEKYLKLEVVSRYVIDEHDGIGLVLYRKSDNKELFIDINYYGEVFYLTWDRVYTYVTASYETEDKMENLDALLRMTRVFIIDKDYYEEIYEKNGKIIPGKIIWSGDWEIPAKNSLLTWIKHFFGYKKKKIKPES